MTGPGAPLVQGVFAALPTPVDSGGRPDLAALDRLVEGVLDAGVTGLCLSGATGEYPHLETAARLSLIRHVAPRLPAGRILLAAVGAPSMALTIDLGRAALDAGCLALLLPMPGFFRYDQDDLAAYAGAVAAELAGPCLLYNLPSFTNPLTSATIAALLTTGRAIVGLKDSSGDPALMDAVMHARGDRSWSLLVGDDRRLRDGLAAGWSGVVSGMAACCPELVLALAASVGRGDTAEQVRLQALLDDLVAHLMVLPVPWGIRVALAARGRPTGPLPLPLSAARRRQIADITAWFPGWLARLPLGAGGAVG